MKQSSWPEAGDLLDYQRWPWWRQMEAIQQKLSILAVVYRPVDKALVVVDRQVVVVVDLLVAVGRPAVAGPAEVDRRLADGQVVVDPLVEVVVAGQAVADRLVLAAAGLVAVVDRQEALQLPVLLLPLILTSSRWPRCSTGSRTPTCRSWSSTRPPGPQPSRPGCRGPLCASEACTRRLRLSGWMCRWPRLRRTIST